MTVPIPFPKPPDSKEDALAYWTPISAPAVPWTESPNRFIAALDQMHRYFSRD